MVSTAGLLATTLALASSAFAASKGVFGEPCNQANTHLDTSTWLLVTDCAQTFYCADNSTCAHRQCRRDIFPIGYNDVPFAELPPLCPQGQFCNDEGSSCFDQVAPGGGCQKDRDDACQFPPNWKDLANYRNVNGSMCLNFTCYWANVDVGQPCVFDNTQYVGETDSGKEFQYIVSRDNCKTNYYCDGPTAVCQKQKTRGQSCGADKECVSYNCKANGVCGKAADEPLKTQPWVYVIIGLAIVILIGGVMVGLWLLHRRAREENQVKLEKYYNEQIAYRQSIMSMSHAKNSLLSLPPNTTPDAARSSLYGNEEPEQRGYSSATANQLLPPNMRRESSAAWSDADSEVLLGDRNDQGPRYRNAGPSGAGPSNAGPSMY